MVEAQEVETLGASGEVHDPRLLGMQLQPKISEDLRRPFTGPFDLLAGGTQDDEVIAIPDQRPEPCPARRPRLIQDVQRDVGRQRRKGRSHATGNFEFERSFPRPQRRSQP